MGCGSDEAFRALIGLTEELVRLFDEPPGKAPHGRVSCQWTPAVDLYEDARAFVMVAEIPGVDQDAIQLEITGDVLVLQGERRLIRPAAARSYHRLERPSGIFRRAFRLPAAVNPEGVKATYREGVLRVILPKKDPGRAVRVEVEG